jgi:hypothetical protein
MDSDGTNRPYAIISSDCHAGADLRDYKPYLERRWHEEFDTWASSYTDAWAGIDTESEYKAGVSSFLSPLNWDSSKRLEVLESRASSPKSSSPTPRHRSSPMACWPPRGRGTGASTTVAGPVSGPTTGGSRTSATRPRSSFRSSAVAPR